MVPQEVEASDSDAGFGQAFVRSFLLGLGAGCIVETLHVLSKVPPRTDERARLRTEPYWARAGRAMWVGRTRVTCSSQAAGQVRAQEPAMRIRPPPQEGQLSAVQPLFSCNPAAFLCPCCVLAGCSKVRRSGLAARLGLSTSSCDWAGSRVVEASASLSLVDIVVCHTG